MLRWRLPPGTEQELKVVLQAVKEGNALPWGIPNQLGAERPLPLGAQRPHPVLRVQDLADDKPLSGIEGCTGRAVDDSPEALDKLVDAHPSRLLHHLVVAVVRAVPRGFLQPVADCRAEAVDGVPQDDELITCVGLIGEDSWVGPVPMVREEATVAQPLGQFLNAGPSVFGDVDEVDTVIRHVDSSEFLLTTGLPSRLP
eukprot:CAMPEP_0173434610 /NCGR_PEP_ID=MMETSP1357-20121228/13145_1 /TAXON_ID=77926 /ORGANISM="Hemiselmis rufescens, Strain PCC563" /LENGTH=198 /DNA_ID=CAMNT_0014399491 /DNA_START=200 /DNA_END=796 /DNA_ORIENTATION=+